MNNYNKLNRHTAKKKSCPSSTIAFPGKRNNPHNYRCIRTGSIIRKHPLNRAKTIEYFLNNQLKQESL